jgi:2-polyprenyl-3-methyl-5-hydroxy-6-metoxy-1,4-benzoquinol methylase
MMNKQVQETQKKYKVEISKMRLLNGAIWIDCLQGVRVATPNSNWTYSACLDFHTTQEDAIYTSMAIGLGNIIGTAGLFLATTEDGRACSEEIFVDSRSSGATVTLRTHKTGHLSLYVRSGPLGTASITLLNLEIWQSFEFNIDNIIEKCLPDMLLWPGERALKSISEQMSALSETKIEPADIGRLKCTLNPIQLNFLRVMEKSGRPLVLEITNKMLKSIETYKSEKMTQYYGYGDKSYATKYLQQSTIRTLRFIELIETYQRSGNTALEIGSLFGQFSLTLQGHGFQTTCIDRYTDYNGAFDGYVDLMRKSGVNVVESSEESEVEDTEALGYFDIVCSMAVIEHIPHTPREFIRMLGRRLKLGGLLIMDTPNIARWWNRVAIANGRTVHQPLKDQYFTKIPFAGHHREYTGDEMIWMMEQEGYTDIKICRFDYNLLQFDELWSDHIDALLEMNISPDLTDTILVAGVKT